MILAMLDPQGVWITLAFVVYAAAIVWLVDHHGER